MHPPSSSISSEARRHPSSGTPPSSSRPCRGLPFGGVRQPVTSSDPGRSAPVRGSVAASAAEGGAQAAGQPKRKWGAGWARSKAQPVVAAPSEPSTPPVQEAEVVERPAASTSASPSSTAGQHGGTGARLRAGWAPSPATPRLLPGAAAVVVDGARWTLPGCWLALQLCW